MATQRSTPAPAPPRHLRRLATELDGLLRGLADEYERFEEILAEKEGDVFRDACSQADTCSNFSIDCGETKLLEASPQTRPRTPSVTSFGGWSRAPSSFSFGARPASSILQEASPHTAQTFSPEPPLPAASLLARAAQLRPAVIPTAAPEQASTTSSTACSTQPLGPAASQPESWGVWLDMETLEPQTPTKERPRESEVPSPSFSFLQRSGEDLQGVRLELSPTTIEGSPDRRGRHNLPQSRVDGLLSLLPQSPLEWTGSRVALPLPPRSPSTILSEGSTYCIPKQLRHSLRGRRGLLQPSPEDTGTLASIRRFVLSPQFDIASGVLIVSNMVYMGIQAHLSLVSEFQRLYDGSSHTYSWFLVDLLFFILFSIELLLRAAGLRRDFAMGPDRWWHALEVVLLVVSMPELINANTSFDVSLFRALRLIRVFRILHLAADSVVVSSLRSMVESLGKSMVCFSPVVLLLGAVIYVFSLLFMQAVSVYITKVDNLDEEATTRRTIGQMRNYYGSAWLTLLTLFMSISGGDSWVLAATALDIDKLGFLPQALFLVYIAFVLFALLNILNGLFVDAAVQSAASKRQVAVDGVLEDKTQMAAEITCMLREADEDDNGRISRHELIEYTRNERIKAYFESLDLDSDSLVRLFDDLDAERNGEVDTLSFVSRCIELRGAAKKADLVLLGREIRRHFASIERALN